MKKKRINSMFQDWVTSANNWVNPSKTKRINHKFHRVIVQRVNSVSSILNFPDDAYLEKKSQLNHFFVLMFFAFISWFFGYVVGHLDKFVK